MALRFLDSFDHYATADLTDKYTQIINASGNSWAIGATGARSTNGARASTGTNQAQNPLAVVIGDVSGDTFICGFRFMQTGAFSGLRYDTSPDTTRLGPSASFGGSAAEFLFCVRQAGTIHFWVQILTNGQIRVIQGNGTVLGTTSNALSTGAFYYMSFKVKIADGTSGTVDILVNGVSWLSVSSLDTRNGGSATWDEFVYGKLVSTASISWDFDDLYLADDSGSGWNAMKSDVRIDALYPTSNGTTRDWTRSTGSDDFSLVDETAPNDDTDYLEAAAAGDLVTMGFPDAPAVGADIYGVQVVVSAKKTDAGSAGHKGATRIGSTDYLGTEVGLTTGYTFQRQCWDLSPDSGVAWTESEFNAAEFGAQKST